MLLLWMVVAVTCLKLLLVPSYHSTDFEVHRNWLAITHSLPLKEWYLDETSPWTLDYPPLFAWFQKLLAWPAPFVDPLIVDVKRGLNHDSPTAVLYMRLTVIFSDIVLFYAVHQYTRHLSAARCAVAAGAIIFSPGLLMVDHIHFQYNGILLGTLILSISLIRSGQDLLGGVLFAVLVCSKHLFMVAGPLYFVYLLRHYCRGPQKYLRFSALAVAVLGVLAVAFGPFIYYKQMPQVLGRLFPFGRGLTHAYWAPNAWALYNSLDKTLAMVWKKWGFALSPKAGALTGGLVGESRGHAVLPQVTPPVTAVLVLLSLFPCLLRVWRQPRPSEFLRCMAYSCFCGFMFGWHVHEKAILTVVVPLALLSTQSVGEAGRFFFLSTVACYSLFPLLFEPREYPIKVVLLALYCLVLWAALSDHFADTADEMPSSQPLEREQGTVTQRGSRYPSEKASSHAREKRRGKQRLLSRPERFYLLGLVLVEVYASWCHSRMFGKQLPFLPLMLVSTYCASGIAYAWWQQLQLVLRVSEQGKERAD